jgi:septum formation protein
MMIILASKSAARHKLLQSAGVSFETASPDVDETAIKRAKDWHAPELAGALADAKALDIARRRNGSLVIGADQVLAMGKSLFDKPASPAEARQQLLSLRGQTHILYSAVACARGEDILWRHCAQARLTMRDFTDIFLEDYLSKIGSDALSSVGGYQIEARGLQLFENIDGDYFTILGLPLLPLLKFLRDVGALPK